VCNQRGLIMKKATMKINTMPFGDEERKITHLVFEGRPMVTATPEQPIESFLINGDMAQITWFRFGNLEFNGKYVAEIGYESSLQEKETKIGYNLYRPERGIKI